MARVGSRTANGSYEADGKNTEYSVNWLPTITGQKYSTMLTVAVMLTTAKNANHASVPTSEKRASGLLKRKKREAFRPLSTKKLLMSKKFAETVKTAKQSSDHHVCTRAIGSNQNTSTNDGKLMKS